MNRVKMIRMSLLALVLTGAMGSVSQADQCVPNPDPICPFIYEPVTCNNGVTYSNQCIADANCAKGCRRAAQ